jgi:hypothetical protein
MATPQSMSKRMPGERRRQNLLSHRTDGIEETHPQTGLLRFKVDGSFMQLAPGCIGKT